VIFLDDAPADLPPPIPASTVIVVRDAAAGLEVLLLKRSDVGAFANMWVFPGGRVDADDEGDDELARARSAAAREAAEEVAVTVAADALVTWSHWTPPAITPKRFATWFFVAAWSGEAVVVDGHEIVDHLWLDPAVALQRDLAMAPPTLVTLAQLSERRSVSEIATLGPPRGVEHFITKPVRIDNVMTLLWHGDAAYHSGELSTPGPRHRMTIRKDSPEVYERSDDLAD
jgi:8-oxo-dGTP pyrophosphatase MutT (NUDIX family)